MKITLNPEYKFLRRFIEELPDNFEQKGQNLYCGRNVVKLVVENGLELVVKRYKRPHIIQRIAYQWFRPSKAQRAYSFALRLDAMGISTPQAVAYIEKPGCGLFLDSFFVSLHSKELPLYPVLVETKNYNRNLAHALSCYLVVLHEKGFLHGDLNLANILYREDGDNRFHFTVIDTNRSHFKVKPTEKDCLSNLMRLTHRVELLRFLVSNYATCRGWDVAHCCRIVEDELHTFEHRRAKKRKLKNKIRR